MLLVVIIVRLRVRGNKGLFEGACLSIALSLWPQYVFEGLVEFCHALGQPRVRHPAPGIWGISVRALIGRHSLGSCLRVVSIAGMEQILSSILIIILPSAP